MSQFDKQDVSLRSTNIGPKDFKVIKALGKGAFGEVYLVEKKDDGNLYAMKILNKEKMRGQNLIKYALTERNVLSMMNCEFIVKLEFAF